MHFKHITAPHVQRQFLSMFYEGKKNQELIRLNYENNAFFPNFLHSKGIAMHLNMISISLWFQNGILQYGLVHEMQIKDRNADLGISDGCL